MNSAYTTYGFINLDGNRPYESNPKSDSLMADPSFSRFGRNRFSRDSCFNVYEFYFDTPVYVHDTFYTCIRYGGTPYVQDDSTYTHFWINMYTARRPDELYLTEYSTLTIIRTCGH